MGPADKIMFEIYREAGYAQSFHVVYFTELDEHNKEQEISRATAGEHLFDGFLDQRHSDEGKTVIEGIVGRLNDGQTLDGQTVGEMLAPYLAD